MKYLNKTNFLKLKNISRCYTPTELCYKIIEKLRAPYRDYNTNIKEYLPGTEELKAQERTIFAKTPKISIVVPTYETNRLFLKQMIDSVKKQTYGNWELCLADGSSSERVEQVVKQEYGEETRIRYRRLEKNGGISENTNQAFAMADGDYIALLDHDDLLVPSALYEMVKRINETDADFLYSDEDKVSADGKVYSDPHFKLEFNRELLLGNNYICHFLVVSRELLAQAGGLDSRYDGAQDFEFVLRCSRYAKRIEHIARVLYHWRVHPDSTAGNTNSKLYAYEAGKRAVEAFIAAEKWNGTVSMTNDLGFYRTRYQVPENIVIGIYFWGEPSRRFFEVQKQLERELAAMKAELIWEYDFSGRADYILVVNCGTLAVQPESLSVLLGSCARTGIGMVGGKTISKRKVWQCGYWKKEETYIPRFRNLPEQFKGYYRRAYLPVEVDAIGNDLAVLRRETEQMWKENITEPGRQEQWQRLCEGVKNAGYRVVAEPSAVTRVPR